MTTTNTAALGLKYKNPVSIVVVNYNVGPMLINCVRSGLDQAEEVIVVDNGSTDQSIELLLKEMHLIKELNVMRVRRNLGFAAACVIGANEAMGKYILFLNPDCELTPGSLNRMVEELEKNPSVGMVGGLLTHSNGVEQGGGRRAVPTPWRSFVRAFGLYHLANHWPKIFFDFHLHNQPLPNKPIEVEAVSGALMLVRQKAIQDVGSWDEGYFLHCEDLDLCMRFRRNGWKILFVPDAPVIHHQGACSRSRPIFVEWHKHKGMNRFYGKFFRHQYPGVLMWLVTAGVWFRFGAVVILFWLKRFINNLIPKRSHG